MLNLLIYLNDMNNDTEFHFIALDKLSHETMKNLNKYMRKTQKILLFFVFSILFFTIPTMTTKNFDNT